MKSAMRGSRLPRLAGADGEAGRRSFIKALVGGAVALGGIAQAPFAQAGAYPSKPVRLIAPYPPGGQTDIVARALAAPLAEALGQTVVVENKSGGNGIVGDDYVAKAQPDGYTLLVGNSATLAVSVSLMTQPFDPLKDFAPITVVAGGPLVLEVNPALPVHSLAELIALAKAKPDELNSGVSYGSIHHLLNELIKLQTGASWADVQYKGAGPMLIDLIGGQIDFTIDNISSSIGYINSGRLRAIAVSKKTDLLPGVPTLEEAGLRGAEAGAWHSVLAPAQTPPEVVHRLNAEIVKILHRPDVVTTLAQLGLDVVGDTPEEFAAFLRAENARWAGVARDAHVKRIE